MSFEAAYAADPAAALEETTNRLLASPHYGERWARHWMDWIRYAETHGSEGDAPIPAAWRYRDSIVRSFQLDLPYDQLVREHLAGDLLEPRLHPDTGINEAQLATAQYRFVLHGFGPTDALDEQVRFTDNQIDVVTKAFQGLTVTCARCHNHKFDPLSQADYYALYGVFASTRPATVTIDSEENQRLHQRRLRQIKRELRAPLAAAWSEAARAIPRLLLRPRGEVATAIDSANSNHDLLNPWLRLRGRSRGEFERGWSELAEELRESQERLGARANRKGGDLDWDLRGPDADSWFRHGNGLPPAKTTEQTAAAGEFTLSLTEDRVVASVLPAGVYSHLLSTKHSGVFASPRVAVGPGRLFVRVAGEGGSVARYAVHNYPMRGEVHPQERLFSGQPEWVEWDLSYWDGEHVHVELTTNADQPVHADLEADRSWWGISEVAWRDPGEDPPRAEVAELWEPLFEATGSSSPSRAQELAELYGRAASEAVSAWSADQATDAQARFLDRLLAAHLLPNEIGSLPKEAVSLVDEYRRLEAEIQAPTRAPGILEGHPFDQPLMSRGNHRQLEGPVPRRFLEALDDRPFGDANAGRLELAERILAPDNPLTARVIVNRIWHHVFGRGLVATPDNFGHMGERPTHPELLDHLALRFVQNGWSIRELVRELVGTETFLLSSTGVPASLQADPENLFLSRAPIRRLEAEAIRDSLLAVSGQLDLEIGGQPVTTYSARRSIYLTTRRNTLDPFLATFDAPPPVSTLGRRNVTNVPAQALAMMNDPFVRQVAAMIAEDISTDPRWATDSDRVSALYRRLLSRPPTEAESRQMLEALGWSRPDNEGSPASPLEVALRTEAEAAFDAREESLRRYYTSKPELLPPSVQPVASWDFERGLRPEFGRAKLRGSARPAAGALALGAGTSVRATEIGSFGGGVTIELWLEANRPLEELELRLQLGPTDSDWRLDLNNTSGESDCRSELFESGPRDELFALVDLELRAAHLAVAVDPRGVLRCFRNGRQVGGKSQLPPPPSSPLRMEIELPEADGRAEARLYRLQLYDRALGASEIDASGGNMLEWFSQRRLLGAMRPAQRQLIERFLAEAEVLETEREPSPFRELAHALLNSKEFLYLR